MKKIFRYTALVCASAAVAISCVEENLEPIIPAVDGDAIVFGVRAGFEDSAPGTKTEYSGQDYTVENSDGTTTKFERIDWVVNDKIEIYSPQAENPYATAGNDKKSTHYVVTNLDAVDPDTGSTGKGSDYAKLANVGEAGLRWNGTQKHDFYAMYPSSEMFRPAGGDIPANIKSGVFMGLDKETNSKVMVYGVVSDVQQPTVVEDPKNPGSYIAKPDMNNAYMVAKTSVDHPTQSSQVKLSFVPIVTAVEIELLNNSTTESVLIREVQVASDEPIVGGFTANLSGWTRTYPECENLTADQSATEEEKEIQISTLIKSGETYTGVTLAPQKSLKVTAFLLPGSKIENLTVRVSSLGITYVSKELKNANIPANLKTRISNLHLPEKNQFTAGGDKWMEQLEDESVIKALSLPGTGGSFTYDATNAAFKQQTLSFEDQWNLGVRAFELQSERPSNATTSLGGQNVTCNKVPVSSWNVYTALTTLIDKVSGEKANKDKDGNFTETAALILTYQPKGNSPGRNPESYAQSLAVMLTKEGSDNCLTAAQYERIIPYSLNLTIKEARGKVILICRPTQRDEDASDVFSKVTAALPDDKVTAINGCGSAKDKWGARGYKVPYGVRDFFRDTYYSEGVLGIGRGWRWNSYTYPNGEAYNYQSSAALDISNTIPSGYVVTDTNTENGTAIDGGYQRGYQMDVKVVENYMQQAKLFADGSIVDNKITYPTSYNNGTVTRPAASTMPPIDGSDGLNFDYPTNNDITCWYQEWARVVPEMQSYSIPSGSWIDYSSTTWLGGNPSYAYDAINWFESYTEKLSNVITTFDMAISAQYPYVFINSLCGYLATDAEDPTYSLTPSLGNVYGGDGGDVIGLSNLLNPAFYNYVVNSGMQDATGPTGIVLMDFVQKEGAANKTAELIAAIIANNQKYATTGPSLNVNPEEVPTPPVTPF